MGPFRAGILGATGLVGQRLVQRLAGHPWFRLTAVAASERSAGTPYAEAARWVLSEAPPPTAADLVVRPCHVAELQDCDLLLSALDAGTAARMEPEFVAAGFPVISNSSAFRMREDVPLLVPEVNPDHLALVESRARAGGGYVVTNPNCSTTGLVIALAPLHRAFGVKRVVVTTLQAVSGAGMDGPRALDLVDNVLPHIPGEEEKIEREVGKILGSVEGDRVRAGPIALSAHCHRVATVDGHLEAVSVELERPASADEAAAALAAYRSPRETAELPSAAARPVVVRREPDRPQPRLDRDSGGGMAVVVGRVRRCPVLGLKLELLSHNTVRGAAGGTVLNVELLARRGLLRRRSAG